MRSVSVRLVDLCKITIPIGFVGENLHTKVRIDCMKLFEEYPTASASMTIKPVEGDAYPAVVTQEGDFIIWDVTDSDLVYPGVGEFQLSFSVGEVVAKSYIGKIRVDRSIVPTGDVPDPAENWIDKATEILNEIEDAFPEGGEKGQVLAKASDNNFDTEWVDLIDDDAGAGDTDKSWSADKLTDELSDVLRTEDASGSTAIQGYEGGVYDVGNTNGNLKVSVPYKRFEVGNESGLKDFTIRKQIDGKTVNVHFLSNNGVVSVGCGQAGTVDEGVILVETILPMQLPPNDPQYQHMVNAHRLFSVASTTETQGIITEYAG